MGLASSQCRLVFLTAYKSDLEFRVQQICSKRVGLAQNTEVLSFGKSAEYKNLSDILRASIENAKGDAEKIAAAQATYNTAKADCDARYEAYESQVQTRDKELEMEQKQLETQRDAATTEVESVRKVIQKNIEMSFKTFMA